MHTSCGPSYGRGPSGAFQRSGGEIDPFVNGSVKGESILSMCQMITRYPHISRQLHESQFWLGLLSAESNQIIGVDLLDISGASEHHSSLQLRFVNISYLADPLITLNEPIEEASSDEYVVSSHSKQFKNVSALHNTSVSIDLNF